MNTALWALQLILGIKLLSVSYTHGLRPSQPAMQDAIRKMGPSARPLHSAIALVAFLGAFGLILPGAVSMPVRVISVTAALLAVILLSSIFFHVRSREKPNVFVSVVLFVFAALIAYGRWSLLP